MSLKKKWLIAAVLALLVLAAAACGGKSNNGGTANTGGTAPASNSTSSTASAQAESVYKTNCISCHAADLSGSVGPNLQKIGAVKTADNIRTQIQNGGGGMPPFKGTLSDADITALTDWLASKK